MAFTNQHLSYSRIARYEQCPLSFKLHYVDKLPSEPGVELKFGKATHATLEALVDEHVRAGVRGPLSAKRAIELWREAWTKEGLVGVGPFEEGLEIVKAFVRREGVLDPASVLGVERKFEIAIGRFTVVGAIDRVDRLDATTIRICDYKTNRLLFTRDELRHSLQLSLYQLAAEQLWPWAMRIELEFDMLRHDVRLRTSRTRDELEAARQYVETLGEQSETERAFAPRLNMNCNYCDHRGQCGAFTDALEGKRSVPITKDLADLEAVAREREEVARIAKIAYARKSELESVLKACLAETERLELGGVRYQLLNACSVEYPLEPTLRKLADTTGLTREELVARLATVNNDALKALLKELKDTLPRPRVTLLQAELDAQARRTFTPRFDAKPVRP